MKSKVFLLIPIFLLAMSTVRAQSDMETYRDLAKQFSKAAESSDPTAIASLFTADAVMTSQEGHMLSGADQIAEYYASTFKMIRYENLQINTMEVMRLGDEAVYGRGDFTSKVVDANNNVMEIKGFFNNVVKIENGQWKIHRHLVMFPQAS